MAYIRLFVLIFTTIAATAASANVVRYGYLSPQNWDKHLFPGGDNGITLTFTILFGATVWFVARGIWLRDRRAQRRNLLLAVLTFLPAILLVLLYAQ